MRIHLLSIGRRMPGWIETGYEEYAKRLPPSCALQLHEIEASRGKGAGKTGSRSEGARLLARIPKGAWVVGLDQRGTQRTTEALADWLAHRLAAGQDLALLIGGPDGLADACRKRAQELWSLSPLTFPHPLVRVLVAEQLYRAWSYLQGHPYHRG